MGYPGLAIGWRRARLLFLGGLCLVTVRWRESFPGLRILTPGRVLTQHMIGSLSDEDHGASAQVDTIDEDDLMNLIDDRAKRP